MKSLAKILLKVPREIAGKVGLFTRDPLNTSNRYSFTKDGVRKAHNAVKRRAGKHEIKRRDYCLSKLVSESCETSIDYRLGYKILSLEKLIYFDEFLKTCINRYPIERIKTDAPKKRIKRDTLLSVEVNILDSANNAIKKLATSELLLAPIGEYLKSPPVLYGVHVWYCQNSQTHDLVGSQLFHMDREDTRQVKVFIPLESINEECGPLTVIDAEKSDIFLQKKGRIGKAPSLKNHFSDDEVRAICGYQGNLMTGEVGDAILVDTSSCLHYGSRPAPSYKYHAVFHYLSSYAPKLYGRIELDQAPNNIEDMVLQYVRATNEEKIPRGGIN